MPLKQYKLPYHHDSARLFKKIAHLSWPMFLDSGQLQTQDNRSPGSEYGRYDILVADPFMTLSAGDTETVIKHRHGSRVSTEDPFQLVQALLSPYQAEKTSLPFSGGAVGYFAYDLARRLEHLPAIAASNHELPAMLVGIYDWAVIVDHHLKTASLVSHGMDPHTHETWDALCALLDSEISKQAPNIADTVSSFEVLTCVTSNMDKSAYADAFNAVQHYIHEGDCYQVNLAQRFTAKVRGNGWVAYQALREISPAPFMAYMNFGDLDILSGSPERFLKVRDREVETRPIKGTRPRATSPALDLQYANDLQSSLKDRAENLMIVDLLRNDLGKNCETGSVKVDQLFQLQSFANVHHLVSIVTGRLKNDKTALDLLRGCFPGGSITGAPKLRAMEIIEALEPHRRGIYCGAIGYIGFDGNMDTNIAIRTAVYVHKAEAGEISFYAGGGIVADSDLYKEYTETLDKASSMLKLMQIFSEPIQE